jgi:hypothetical protein
MLQECLDAYKRKVDEANEIEGFPHLQLIQFTIKPTNVTFSLGEDSFFNIINIAFHPFGYYYYYYFINIFIFYLSKELWIPMLCTIYLTWDWKK